MKHQLKTDRLGVNVWPYASAMLDESSQVNSQPYTMTEGHFILGVKIFCDTCLWPMQTEISEVLVTWCVLAASPYWRHGKPPSDFTVDDEDDVDVECHALGRPKPNITWSFNGTDVARELLYNKI